MSNETIKFTNNMIEQRRVKIKQLTALRTRKTEETEKEAKLSKLLAQAELDHNACMRSNLAGDASDQKLKESKISLKELTDRLQETKKTIEFISEDISRLNHESSDLRGDIAIRRADACTEIAKEIFDEITANKKFYKKLVDGYAVFLSSHDHNKSWLRFVLLNFPQPGDRNIRLAEERFKESNDFMRD